MAPCQGAKYHEVLFSSSGPLPLGLHTHAHTAPMVPHQQRHFPQASRIRPVKVLESGCRAFREAAGIWAEASREHFSQFPSETTEREVLCL